MFKKQLELTETDVKNIKIALKSNPECKDIEPLIKNNVILNLDQLKLVSNTLHHYSYTPNFSHEEYFTFRRLAELVFYP